MAAGKSGHVFKNWCFAHSCKPELYFEPTCEDDIRQVLRYEIVSEMLLQLS